MALLNRIFLCLLIFQFCPGGLNETSDYKEQIKEKAYDRLNRISFLLESKFIRGEVKSKKLTNPEDQIRTFRNTKDVNLLLLMAEYAHKEGGKKHGDPKKAVYKFIANIFAIILDMAIAEKDIYDEKGNFVETIIETRFGQFNNLFDKMKQIRMLISNGHNKNGHNLDTMPAIGILGESDWGLVYMPRKGLDKKIMAENLPNVHSKTLRSYSAALDRMEIIANFLLKAIKKNKVFNEPKKFHEMVLAEWAPENGKKLAEMTEEEIKKHEEKKGNTLGLFEIYEHLASDSQYSTVLKKGGNEKKLKEKLEKLIITFYLVILNSYVNNKQFLKQYLLIFDRLSKVKEHYKGKMAADKLDWGILLKGAIGEMKEKLVAWKNVLMKRKDNYVGWLEYNGKYAYITEQWSWIYASDNFFEVALKTEKEDKKIGELSYAKEEPRNNEGQN